MRERRYGLWAAAAAVSSKSAATPAKNTLTADDARRVEAEFQLRLAAIEPGPPEISGDDKREAIELRGQDRSNETPPAVEPGQFENTGRKPEAVEQVLPDIASPATIQRYGEGPTSETTSQAPQPRVVPSKEVPPGRRRRVAAKTIRLRDKEHCKSVAKQPCIVCGRTPAEAHHLRFAQPRALGRKVSDELAVPVCRVHHRELHSYGDEASWWAGVSVDPVPIALALWRESRSGSLGTLSGEGSETQTSNSEDIADPQK